MKRIVKTTAFGLLLLAAAASPGQADVSLHGFLQGLWGGRLDQNNPTATEQTASETRMQLRVEHFGDNAEVFGRLDFFWDGADTADYDWELREGYLKFRIGSNIDVKAGRQILTWGTGDLIFINDVFAKDYRSFFVGRDDQYLKAPQNALRAEYYNSLGSFSVVWTPRFEPNRLPTGDRLSYYSPFDRRIVGTGLSPAYYFDPPTPEPKFENGEIATRFQRTMGPFSAALYFYKGFYKNPLGVRMVMIDTTVFPMPVYPKLNLWGASLRGTAIGGILWVEAGYYDSRQDKDDDNPLMPNSSVVGLAGYERQVATNLTINLQWQVDYMFDYDKYLDGFRDQSSGEVIGWVRDEARHLLTTRIRKLVNSELILLEAFLFYSPTDEDAYLRLLTEYKYTDEVTLAIGANIFDGQYEASEFGQFQRNDNIYAKLTYGF
ncbi:MAG: hypothetical protein RBT76_12120 [candidate division Zixibacteria bacterium]|jgi:hypothetical protein|nr:hypothetical protein [candidate division Zixibacteria bacterium]